MLLTLGAGSLTVLWGASCALEDVKQHSWLDPLGTSSICPRVMTTRMSPDSAQCPSGATPSLVEKHCSVGLEVLHYIDFFIPDLIRSNTNHEQYKDVRTLKFVTLFLCHRPLLSSILVHPVVSPLCHCYISAFYYCECWIWFKYMFISFSFLPSEFSPEEQLFPILSADVLGDKLEQCAW